MKNLYHVTLFNRLESVARGGLQPGSRSTIGRGGYAGHSKGRLFLTEFAGVDFWYSRTKDHAESQSDNLKAGGMAPVVLRVKTPTDLEPDPVGTRDANHDAFFATKVISPSDIEVWDGSRWRPVKQWAMVDDAKAFDPEEVDGETLWYFDNDDPLMPLREVTTHPPMGEHHTLPEGMSHGVVVERVMNEIYHTTKRNHIADIIFDGKIKGRPYVSLSTVPQTKFGDFILVLYEPPLRPQLVEVEYTAEWAEANRKRVNYIVSGSSGGRGSWASIKDSFLDYFSIDRVHAEREWQSKASEIALKPGSVKKILVQQSMARDIDWIRKMVVETKFMDPEDVVGIRGTGNNQRAFKRRDKINKRRVWQVKHGLTKVRPVAMPMLVHGELLRATQSDRDIPEETKEAIKKAKVTTYDYLYRFDVPTDDFPHIVKHVRDNMALFQRTADIDAFGSAAAVKQHREWLKANAPGVRPHAMLIERKLGSINVNKTPVDAVRELRRALDMLATRTWVIAGGNTAPDDAHMAEWWIDTIKGSPTYGGIIAAYSDIHTMVKANANRFAKLVRDAAKPAMQYHLMVKPDGSGLMPGVVWRDVALAVEAASREVRQLVYTAEKFYPEHIKGPGGSRIYNADPVAIDRTDMQTFGATLDGVRQLLAKAGAADLLHGRRLFIGANGVPCVGSLPSNASAAYVRRLSGPVPCNLSNDPTVPNIPYRQGDIMVNIGSAWGIIPSSPARMHDITHELGHAFFWEKMDEKQRTRWRDYFAQASGHITGYAKSNAEEDFAETWAFVLLKRRGSKSYTWDRDAFIRFRAFIRSGSMPGYREIEESAPRGVVVARDA
jgi:hypothetical protein